MRDAPCSYDVGRWPLRSGAFCARVHVRRVRAAWTQALERSARGAPVTKIDEIGERENVCVCAVRARAETGGTPSGSGVRVVGAPACRAWAACRPVVWDVSLVCGVGSVLTPHGPASRSAPPCRSTAKNDSGNKLETETYK